jgi:Putative peptidoglycan-binding domain-containing protein
MCHTLERRDVYEGIEKSLQKLMVRTFIYGEVNNLSSDEITTEMSEGGELYGLSTKAVALANPSAYCTVDRVRCYPLKYGTSPIDLRINPNYSSNWVGTDQANGTKQVKSVQSILYAMNYLDYDDIDGVVGWTTAFAIQDFQLDHNLPGDGIVGPNTWRVLCSARYFTYGADVWGDISE